MKKTSVIYFCSVLFALSFGAGCQHQNANAKDKNDSSWCTGLCETYRSNEECVRGQRERGKRENEAKAECGSASAGCYPSGCWK